MKLSPHEIIQREEGYVDRGKKSLVDVVRQSQRLPEKILL